MIFNVQKKTLQEIIEIADYWHTRGKDFELDIPKGKLVIYEKNK